MDDACTMGRAYGARHLADNPQRLIDGESANACQAPLKRLTAKELHDYVGAPITVVAKVKDFNNAWVLNPSCGPSFIEEPVDDLALVGQFGKKHLHRRCLADQLVLGTIDDSHAAFADPLRNAVVADELTQHVTHLTRRSVMSLPAPFQLPEDSTSPALANHENHSKYGQ